MAETVITFKEEEFATQIAGSTPVLVDFWAAWCGPCKMISPVVDEIAEIFRDEIIVGKVNVDENPGITATYGVMNIPTLILFKDGKEIERIVGYQSKEDLSATVKKVIGT